MRALVRLAAVAASGATLYFAGIVSSQVSYRPSALGAGAVFLSTSGVLPLLPDAAYLALEALAGAGALALAWRERRTSPELGAVLAAVPLFFAQRSLFSYLFLLPHFAFAGLARMPLGRLTVEAARAAGALILLAAPRQVRPAKA